LVTALVVLLLVGGGYGIYRALAPGGGAAMVSVPRVVGDSRAAAENTLRNASLTPRVNEVDGKDDDTLDTVVSQNPTDGRVAADSVVTLEVNVGKKTGTIPTGLLGRDVDDVKKILEDAGFRVRTDKVDDPPAGTGKDDVTAVDPSEGTSVALRTRITVSYAGRSATSGSDSSTRKASAGTSAEPTRSTSSADPTAEESSTSPTARPTDDDSSEPSDPTSTGKPTSGKPTSSKPSSGKPTSGRPTKSKPTKSKPTRSKKENPPQPGPGNG
jgi:beta-lactam-binding protein with PASTA domain